MPYDGLAGRYQKVHVNPVVTAMGTAGNNSWEGNRRTMTGSPTTTTGGNGVPQYPNAWCRLQRKGQTFTIYRSDGSVAWTQLGSTTWPDSADTENKLMSDKLYVGIDFSPENANITDTALQGMWVAKFRDYGDTLQSSPQPAELGQTVNGYQDDFTAATRDPNWVAVGPGGDRHLQQDGVLKVFASTGDPNHLLYMAPGASNTVNEVLARVRVVNFGSGDPARGGITECSGEFRAHHSRAQCALLHEHHGQHQQHLGDHQPVRRWQARGHRRGYQPLAEYHQYPSALGHAAHRCHGRWTEKLLSLKV